MAIRPLMILPPAIFAALAGLFLAGLFTEDDETSALQGRKAPPLEEAPLPGYPALMPEMLRDGEVKLVNFWASWCGPCRVEHPQIAYLSTHLPVYGVNYKDNPEAAVAFLAELGNPYAAITQDGGARALDWGITGVPETFLLGGDGTILARLAGPVVATTFATQLGPDLEALGFEIDLQEASR